MKVVITAAVVGAEVMRQHSPHIPYTAAEIAQAGSKASAAGAAVLHLHARETDGRPSQKSEHFRRIIQELHALRCQAILQVSTGGAVGMSIDERLGSLVPEAEMATLNLGSMNFGDGVFENREPDIITIAERIRQAGLIPECEVYDAGHLDSLRRLRDQGHLPENYHVQFVLGVRGGIDASEEDLRFLVDKLHRFEPNSPWSVAGIGRHQFPMAELALRWGGHVRVGLEDNLYVRKGELAEGSHQLVGLVAEMAQREGRTVATISEAREMFGLSP